MAQGSQKSTYSQSQFTCLRLLKQRIRLFIQALDEGIKASVIPLLLYRLFREPQERFIKV